MKGYCQVNLASGWKGDTLTSIVKHYGTQVSTLLELNPSIKDKDEIAVGIVLRVPPNKQSNDRNSERRNPPKSKSADEPAKSSASTPSAVQTRQPESGVSSNQSAIPAQHNATIIGQRPTAFPTPADSNNTSTPNQQVQQQRTPKMDVQPIRKVESSNREGNSVTTLTPECVCKQYDLIWGAKVNCAFRKKVVEVAEFLWGSDKKIEMANNLMAIMAWESGETFKSGVPNQGGSGGTGLIQIMPDTAKDYVAKGFIKSMTIEYTKDFWGKSLMRVKEIAALSELEYLELLKEYFKSLKGKNVDLGDLYLKVLFPASSGKPEHAVFADSKDKLDPAYGHMNLRVKAFASNNMDGWIINSEGEATRTGKKDGRVMKSEITAAVMTKYNKGKLFKSENKDGCSVLNLTKTNSDNEAEVVFKLIRKWQTRESTIGEFTIEGTSISGYILEEKGPDTVISGIEQRIPVGIYNLSCHVGSHIKKGIKVYNNAVSINRAILIHSGNRATDTEGCLIVGATKSKDYVGSSASKLKEIFQFLENEVGVEGGSWKNGARFKKPVKLIITAQYE